MLWFHFVYVLFYAWISTLATFLSYDKPVPRTNLWFFTLPRGSVVCFYRSYSSILGMCVAQRAAQSNRKRKQTVEFKPSMLSIHYCVRQKGDTRDTYNCQRACECMLACSVCQLISQMLHIHLYTHYHIGHFQLILLLCWPDFAARVVCHLHILYLS